ncbi:hypothetical protein CS022_08740 [Veronia nyctiphanis]|uniref:Beta-lactamase-related domain-containing protein n=1 Tax=Veronia nyctiphanis TaxID=1278244 RepID=A0A4Q0YWJ7_9GAMM|nr:serine hydrolase [Veronia nyctiphanis]RXJ73579.1 hypothetical protein CS022_08740 [Veronia nyctiphanis]
MKLVKHFIVLSGLIGLAGCQGINRLGEIDLGTGYAAHELCSRLFISGESQESIVANVIEEKTYPLTWVWDVEVNERKKTVSVSAPFFDGFHKKTAVYREGMGCTVAIDKTPDTLQNDTLNTSGTPAARDLYDLSVAISEPAQSAIQNWFNDPKDAENQNNTYAVIVYHQGKIVAEQYADGYSKDMPMLGWSMGKSITALLTGILADQGKLSPDDIIIPSSERVPDPIKIKHLLNMASGLKWDERYNGESDVSNMLYKESDTAGYVKTRSAATKPGTEFVYSTGDTQLLAGTITERLGGKQQAAYDFYQQKLFHPLGISDGLIEFDESGTFIGGARPFLNPRDWLKIGILYEQKGNWRGKQLVSESWVDMLLTPSPASPYYGGQVWLKSDVVSGFPDDMFTLKGHLGQYITVLPSKDLIVLTLGLHNKNTDKDLMERILTVTELF